jgi:hypothetical protein
VFRWKVHRRRVVPGDIAGSIQGDGYVMIGINGKSWKAHRLAWLYVHGEWPQNDIDHVNGVRTDNRLENLRVVSRQDNSRHRVFMNKNNTSGIVGVSYHKATGKWQASMHVAGKQKYLGLYDTQEQAKQARPVAKETKR